MRSGPTLWLTLSCGLVVAALGYIEWVSRRNWVDQWIPNLATEIVGIAVTVAIVNTLFARAADRQRAVEQAPLVSHVRRELDETLELGIHMAISVCEDTAAIRRLSAGSLMREAIPSLDPSSSARSDEWAEFWMKELEAIARELGTLRSRYAGVLSPALIRAIDVYVDGATRLSELEMMARAARTRGRMDAEKMAQMRLAVLGTACTRLADVIESRDEFIGEAIDVGRYWKSHDQAVSSFRDVMKDIPK